MSEHETAPVSPDGTVEADETRANEANGGETNSDEAKANDEAKADEIGGPRGPEPTRYGDWERKGRCIDF